MHKLNCAGQTNDWMAEIYERWTAAHAVLIVTPVYWYQSPGPLKLMIDRLVCADGGNPDPTSTGGKKPSLAKDLEMAGWDYPQHLAGRAYGLIVHGDVAGVEGSRRALSDWLDWMGLIDAGAQARLDRYDAPTSRASAAQIVFQSAFLPAALIKRTLRRKQKWVKAASVRYCTVLTDQLSKTSHQLGLIFRTYTSDPN